MTKKMIFSFQWLEWLIYVFFSQLITLQSNKYSKINKVITNINHFLYLSLVHLMLEIDIMLVTISNVIFSIVF